MRAPQLQALPPPWDLPTSTCARELAA
jgi:hypothetical protein